ncbi:hypothetical protein CSUI_004964, partial [Cystoisospora suis]
GETRRNAGRMRKSELLHSAHNLLAAGRADTTYQRAEARHPTTLLELFSKSDSV